MCAYSSPHSQSRKRPREHARITWEYVGKTNSEYWFRNVRTVHRGPKGSLLAWLRLAVPAPDMDYAFRSNKNITWSSLLEENGYSLQLWEFDCSTDKMRTVQDVSYDGDGKVVSQHLYRNPSWSHAIPDSIGEAALRATCGH